MAEGMRAVERGKIVVENKRFGGKETEKGRREGRRRNIRTLPSRIARGIEGSHFLLPFLERRIREVVFRRMS